MAAEFKKAVKETNPDKRQDHLTSLKEYEHKNDNLTHRVFMELGKNFITPFDREDIHSLAMSLDDVADYMYACYNKMTIYNVNDEDNYINEMVEVVEKSVDALCKAVHQLRNMKNMEKMRQALIEINSQENRADELLNKALHDLFASEKDAIQLLKKKEVYEIMELITDKCENSADVLESIIIKYS